MHRSLKKQSKKTQTSKTLIIPDAEVYHEDLTDYQPLQAQSRTMQVEDNVFQACISDDESQSNFESNLNNISKKIKKNEGTEQLLPQQNSPIELDLPLLPSEEDYQSLNVLDQTNVVIDPSEKILPREFFTVHPVTLSKNLVGKILVRRVGNQVIKARIVETEAYNVNDMACHAHHGKRTERTKPLFMQGGHLYVFLIYGVSYCLNITATVEGEPSACLIRAVEIIEGHDHVIANRNVKNPSKSGKELTNGPGKLSAALKVDKSLNFYDVTKPGEFYVVEGDGSPFEMVVSKRINIEYAGEDKHKPWRFYIKDNKFVSVKGAVLDVVDPVQFCKQVYDEDEDEVIEKNTTVSVTSTTTTTTTMNSISMFDLDKFRFTK